MATDRDLVQIVDAAMAQAVAKSGSWLQCKPGCAECCRGAFPITQLDAARLQEGLAKLEISDPPRAARVRRRAHNFIALSGDFPGDPATGILAEDEESEERFAAFAEDALCPALDTDTLTCDLYASRPLTCRIFGPAVSSGGDALGVCELNYVGATTEQIAACQVEVDPHGLEEQLLQGRTQQTIVAFALR
jgi:Fe-S-cluster containining protein